MNRFKEMLIKIAITATAGAIIFFLIILLYAPSINYDFVSFDDDQLVAESQIPITDWGNIKKTFQRPVFEADSNYFRPLLNLSLMFDAFSSKFNPYGYHRTNILLHALAVILVYLFLGQYFPQKKMIFLFSLWYAIHPLFVSNVVWIPGRNDILLAIFSLPLFIFLVKYLRTGKSVYLWLQLLFFLLALFTKETAIVFPLLALVIYFVERPIKISMSGKIGVILLWATAIVCWLVVRGQILSNHVLLMYTITYFRKTFVSNASSLLVYPGKMFFPFNLSVFPISKSGGLYPGIMAFLALIGLLWFSREKRKPIVVLGLFWFILLLLPVMLVHNVELTWGEDMQLESRMYLPMIGLMIILLETDPVKKLIKWKAIPLAVMALVIIIFAGISYKNSRSYQDKLTFWQSAVNSSPGSSVAHQMLAGIQLQEKWLVKAEKEFELSLQLNPLKSGNYAGLGTIALEKEDFTVAKEYFYKELRVNPQSAETYFNLGRIYYSQGDLNKAAGNMEKSLDLNRDLVEAYGYLGVIYFSLNDLSKARYYVKEAGKRGAYVDQAVTEFLK